MFKKPTNVKTSAPLRSSDRRKLKQRVIQSFALSNDDADILVPDGILVLKFTTHVGEPGLAYLSPAGDALWFTLGKDPASSELIPTVHTLWTHPSLLPTLSTPPSVIPVLTGGADLMIRGVSRVPPGLASAQLVAITQYTGQKLSLPLAVGHMAVGSDAIRGGSGKAVHVLHAWKDFLWEMGPGRGRAMPGGQVSGGAEAETSDKEISEEGETDIHSPEEDAPQPPPLGQLIPTATYTPAEISEHLHTALIQSLATLASNPPPPGFLPISANTFYTTHILPARPVSLPPPAYPSSPFTPTPLNVSTHPVTLKSSTHKSLAAFLKPAEKLGLLTLKTPNPNSRAAPDLLITALNTAHPAVETHRAYRTVAQAERLAQKQKADSSSRSSMAVEEIKVLELWKLVGAGAELFGSVNLALDANERAPPGMLTLQGLRSVVMRYVEESGLVNVYDRAWVEPDARLWSVLGSGSKIKGGKGKGVAGERDEGEEFMKREEVLNSVMAGTGVQSWYLMSRERSTGDVRKGPLKPITIAIKMRQGRKATTVVVDFEPFLPFMCADSASAGVTTDGGTTGEGASGMNAEQLAEELRRVCACSASVMPHGATPHIHKLIVQGQHMKPVTEVLVARGVPRRWIANVK